MKSTIAVKALAALAQEHRLAIFRLLIQQGPKGLPAGMISNKIGMPPATLSFHLNHLNQADLIISKRNGRSIIYTANYGAMEKLVNYLMENCCKNAKVIGRQ